MFFYQVTVIVFLCLVKMSTQATDDGVPPVLTIKIPDVQLAEKEDARKSLGSVVSCVDADGDPIRAYISSILPTSGCGLHCLQLEPTNNNQFKLMFQPTSGFPTAPSYTLTIECTDDLEAVVQKTMGVTIESNSPPTFKPSSPPYASEKTNGQKTSHDTNYKLYKVQTDDPDDDAVVYTMSTNPRTPYIEIEYATGQIRAAQDLRLLCEQQVVASVSARDPYNPIIGPFTVDINIDKNNVRPKITNLDTTLKVDENTAAGKTILAVQVEDGKLEDFTYNQISLSCEGMESYYMKSNNLKTRVDLNYEREKQRFAKLYFTVNDGYCKSDLYTLDVEIVDVPEPPELTHEEMFIEVYEGEINTPSNVFVLDEDLDEDFTFSELGGTDDEFDIDPVTGNIIGSVTLKKNTKYKDFTVKMAVTDKHGLSSSKYTAKVRVYDANTNRPYFNHQTQPLRLSALDCTPPGAQLGKLKGKDDDSQWNLNSWYYFGGGGENIAVAANGNLILTQYCISGESYTGTVTITDQGIFPGPLTGEPMDVILDCGPCPPGGYPGEGDGTDDGDDADSSNSTSSSNTTGTSDDGQDGEGVGSQDVLAWFIPSILCLGIWLALTAIFLYRFCPPCKCGNPCSKPKIIRVTPEPAEPSRPQFLKARPSLPPPPPRQMAPPPPPPPPARVVSPSEPYLYDFWKETYTDQDQSQHPNRNVRPTAIERMPAAHRNIPPQNLRLGPPGTYNNAPRHLTGTGNIPAPAVDPPPKSKSCAIL